MFQFAFEASLFRLRQRKPSLRPLLQLPKRRPTRTPEAQKKTPVNFTLKSYLGEGPQTPYAATPTGGNRRTEAPTSQSATEAASFR